MSSTKSTAHIMSEISEKMATAERALFKATVYFETDPSGKDSRWIQAKDDYAKAVAEAEADAKAQYTQVVTNTEVRRKSLANIIVNIKADAEAEAIETEAIETEAIETEAIETEAIETAAIETAAIETEAIETEAEAKKKALTPCLLSIKCMSVEEMETAVYAGDVGPTPWSKEELQGIDNKIASATALFNKHQKTRSKMLKDNLKARHADLLFLCNRLGVFVRKMATDNMTRSTVVAAIVASCNTSLARLELFRFEYSNSSMDEIEKKIKIIKKNVVGIFANTSTSNDQLQSVWVNIVDTYNVLTSNASWISAKNAFESSFLLLMSVKTSAVEDEQAAQLAEYKKQTDTLKQLQIDHAEALIAIKTLADLLAAKNDDSDTTIGAI
jgi:hypothetical protein